MSVTSVSTGSLLLCFFACPAIEGMCSTCPNSKMGTHLLDPGMTENKLDQEEMQSLIVLKNETKLVMEAFLRRMMMHNEAAKVGHVGRYYHDAKKFISKTPEGQDSNVTAKAHVRRKSNQKGTLERDPEEKKKSLKRAEGAEEDTEWDTSDEEIAQAEEKKHGFRTTIKRLIRRQRKKKSSSDDSNKKSKDSLDLLEAQGSTKHSYKADPKANSLKRQKSLNPLIACAVGSMDSVSSVAKEVATQEGIKHSFKKSSGQRFLNLFKKPSQGKTVDHSSEKSQESEPPSPRPNTLSLIDDQLNRMDIGSGKNENVEFYSKVAKKLDTLARQYCAQTNVAPLTPISDDAPEKVNNNFSQDALTDKEKMIEKIVLLLQQQGDGIDEKIKEDPMLQRTMSRMSYHSFSQLVEVFTANAEEQHEGPTSSPELTKIALTMELTRRVAGISSHPVQQLMGYSMQYMDMFVPWLQENGGWTMVFPLDNVSEHQID
ncbi:apoptosis facilitator Bcl-2-like protein 14 [Scyliorhinus canicula]|uniref:apoptosis facilitator Bcl-2-like protein 14 n=1 Tax=Scyliorhinus canicula TaxID=7830 RepID=UPI0018F77E96|nr:apoptosis facilitator Bcl-2-like protein 14 [Scyliorhinus canicula]